MRKLLVILVLGLVVLFIAGCAPSCKSLTPAQCANLGAHEYVRTYEFIEGCGSEASFIEGVSEINWTFSSSGASVEFPMLFPEAPPAPIDLVKVEPDAYQPALDEPGVSLIRLRQDGFVWVYFDVVTAEPCYQVVFTLPEN